ncbi:hypothetical protein F5887DRAFT_925144 [Amanita rubescens]|nr:hypothetical protein F5887DRAFT_925144 [Amanita rubescens]
MPPPKIPLMPASRTIATRASNKNARPGLVDLSPGKRERAAKKTEAPTSQDDPALKALQDKQQAQARKRVAEIEDRNRLEDEAFDRSLHESAPIKPKALRKKQGAGEDDFFTDDDPAPITNKRKAIEVSDTSDSSDSDDSSSSSSDDTDDDEEKKMKKAAKKLKKKAKKAKKKAKKGKKKAEKKKAKKPGRKDINALRDTQDAGVVAAVKRNSAEFDDDSSQKGKSSKRTKKNGIDHGIDSEWENMVKDRGAHSTMNKLMAGVSLAATDDPDSMAQFGGPIPEGETDDIEARTIKAKPTSTEPTSTVATKNKGYAKVKVEDTPTVTRKLKEIRNGDEKWKLEHLSDDKRVQSRFTEKVAPLARKKAASLDPWSNLNVDQVQVIVDQVYGAGMYEVTEDSAWLGLVTARLQSWRNMIANKALEAVEKFLKDNKSEMEKMVREDRQENPQSELTLNDVISDQIKAYLAKKPVYAGSELHMHAYQWADWNGGVDSKVN